MKLSELSLEKQLEMFEIEDELLTSVASVRGPEAYCTLVVLRNVQIAVQFVNALAQEYHPQSGVAFRIFGDKVLANIIPPLMELSGLPPEEQKEVLRLFDLICKSRK